MRMELKKNIQFTKTDQKRLTWVNLVNLLDSLLRSWERDKLIESKLKKTTKLNSQTNTMLKGKLINNRSKKWQKKKEIRVNLNKLVKLVTRIRRIW